MIVVASMHGALGFNGSKRDRDRSDLLNEGIALAKIKSYAFLERRGSIFRQNQRGIQDFITLHNSPKNVLCIFGHSTGAWNLIHALNRMHDNPGTQYRGVFGILTDINHGPFLHNRNHETISIHHEGAQVFAFAQSGFLGGATLAAVTDDDGIFTQVTIEANAESHTSIATCAIVRAHLNIILKSARNAHGN